MFAREVYMYDELSCPTENFELQSLIWKGYIAGCMSKVYKESSEDKVRVFRKPEVAVKAIKAIKSGKLLLTCLTRSIAFFPQDGQKKNIIGDGARVVADCFKFDGNPVHAVLRADLQFPTKQKKTGCAQHVLFMLLLFFRMGNRTKGHGNH